MIFFLFIALACHMGDLNNCREVRFNVEAPSNATCSDVMDYGFMIETREWRFLNVMCYPRAS